jgi:hypothetical protein
MTSSFEENESWEIAGFYILGNFASRYISFITQRHSLKKKDNEEVTA